MGVGARDTIDRKLVKMYATVQTSNFELTSKVPPDDMMNSMCLMAMNNKIHIDIKSRSISRKSDLRDIA